MNLAEFRSMGHLLVAGCGAIEVANLGAYLTRLRQSVCTEIHVILTRQAQAMASARTIMAVTGHPVFEPRPLR